jgi:hypothetical protein
LTEQDALPPEPQVEEVTAVGKRADKNRIPVEEGFHAEGVLSGSGHVQQPQGQQTDQGQQTTQDE